MLPYPLKKPGNLRKPRRQGQREIRKTKGLMRRTFAVHVGYNVLYISLRPLQNNNV